MLIQFPGAVPPEVAKVLGDNRVDPKLRDALRVLATGGEEARPDALDVIREGIDGDEHGPRALRLFPALVALAAARAGFERTALVGSAGSIEMVRLAVGVDVPDDLVTAWEDARVQALGLLAPLLGDADLDPLLLAPMLAAIAALHGDGPLASVVASADELLNDVGGDDDDEFDDEEEDDDGVR